MTAEDTFGKELLRRFRYQNFMKQKRCTKLLYNDNKSLLLLCYYSKIDKLKKCLKINLKNNEERNHGRKRKKKKEFILGILFDAVECCLYGAFVWRVFRCHLGNWQHLMTRMYKGTAGKVGGVVTL
jgi:hypothetical protein